jgi:hypothetical protein
VLVRQVALTGDTGLALRTAKSRQAVVAEREVGEPRRADTLVWWLRGTDLVNGTGTAARAKGHARVRVIADALAISQNAVLAVLQLWNGAWSALFGAIRPVEP